jgi:hypothetical protein
MVRRRLKAITKETEMTRMMKGVAACGMILLAAGLMLTSVGCAGQAKAAPVNLRVGIPANATLVSSGTAPSFTATEPGRMYVYDVTDNYRIGAYNVRKDQTFLLDPKSGRATIDANEVVIDDVERNHIFQIYFESDSSRAAAVQQQTERSITVYKEDADATRRANENR